MPDLADGDGITQKGRISDFRCTIVKDEPLLPPSSKIKRVGYFYSRWTEGWKYRNMNSKVTVETLPILGGGRDDPWKNYSFVVVRTIPQQENRQPTFKIVIKSEYILKVCQDVIQTWPGISWHADPLESFIAYRDALAERKGKSEQEANMLASVNVLLEFLAADYRSTIKTIERLTAHGEITFELLYAILVPRTLVVARCAVTGLERLFQLQPLPGQAFGDGALVHSQANATTENADLSPEDLLLTPTVVYGFSLSDKLWRTSSLYPFLLNSSPPSFAPSSIPVLAVFEFDVAKVVPVAWNADAFANLVLPADRKTLLRSLVEAHHEEAGFDDFVKGKGAGLVVNLFRSAWSKTFSAEATSEHVKRPLYVIGGGDLGTRAADLDMALERVFDVATCWKAIVLIDEADVFLERRSLHDLERNAMVAVFLRHVEYYRGILFLTTNRVQAFDEAFLSRIHVALHFAELSEASRAQVWRAFIGRAGVQGVDDAQIAQLARRDVNGRQIKNAVRTAHSLALGRKEQVGLSHFLETLDAMDEFTEQFEGMKAAADQVGE
ncbi:P-loop containing nucleoside triphosphate hydrolase protein [Mycena epipterygia]|nr:P-loop containing nucleoside triphosphate hydrolase protein [Mycena epipterygia]